MIQVRDGRFELSFLSYDEGSEVYFWRPEEGSLAGGIFLFTILICDNPMCPCCDARFLCIPADKKGKVDTDDPEDPWSVTFDVNPIERKIVKTRLKCKSSLAKPVRNAFMREMTEEDWDILIEGIVAAKRDGLAEVKTGKRKVDFPAELIDHPDVMIGYSSFFPYEEAMTFDAAGQSWLLDDEYCVNPDCPCTSVALSMAALRQEMGKRKVLRPDRVVFYDYATGEYEKKEGLNKLPDLDRLVLAIENSFPDLRKILKGRHQLMRKLFNAFLQRQDKGTVSRSKPATPSGQPKTGRNDPCPCGSGKKYKRCCGRSA